MKALIDTNILVRHRTGDPPARAARATRFLAEAPALVLTEIVAAELVYVLESFFEVERLDFAEATLVARAEASAVRAIASFDRALDRIHTVDRIEP